MSIKEIFSNLKGRLNTSNQVKNEESNNVINSPDSNIQGNNYGAETIHGDKITQFNNFTFVVNNENTPQDIKTVDLEDDINKIKKIPNYSYSLKAIEEYNKLLLVHYPKHISNEDYIKILLNICYIYINRNELDKVKEFIYKLDETCTDTNKDVIKVKGLIEFNSQEYKLALDIMNKVKWSIDDKFEYVLYQSLRCINKLSTYQEFRDMVLTQEELMIDNTGSIFHLIAITARYVNEYEDMLLYSSKAFGNTEDMHSKLQYAHSLYDYAIKDSIHGDVVKHDKINYQHLIESKLLCEKSLKLAEETKDIKLYKDSLVLYVNILSLLGQIKEAIDSLKNIKFIENNEELVNFEDRLKSLYGQEDNKTSNISEDDLFLKEIFDLLDSKRYSEVISKIESKCWDKYKEDIKVHCILLECYIENQEYPKFINHIRKLEYIKSESNLLIKVKARYHIEKEEYEKAEIYLNESVTKYRDPDAFCWLLNLYNKLEEIEKFEDLVQRILNEDKFVLEVEYVRVYTSYFKFLFKNNFYDKALEILNNYCDKKKFGVQNYINASINIFSHLGRYFDSAQELEKLFELNNDYETLFNAANEYFRCNELDKCLDMLKVLEEKKVNFLEKVYVMISNIYVLKSDIDSAYEYAEKAKELVKDIPRSEVHNFFVSRSLRCNKVDNGVLHLNEFRESYPKVDDWVKCLKSIEVDDEGKEELSSEITEFLKVQSEGFINLLKLLKSGQVGISHICKNRNYTINELIRWKDIYGIKININGGNNDEITNEINNLSENIVVDAFMLYILSDINQLEVLRSFKDVRICNSTIEYLNYMILKEEDKNVRKILLYIQSEINIHVVYTNHFSKNNFETEFRSLFDDFILDSVLYAKENGYSYCYGETHVKQLCNIIGTNSISLVSLVRSLNQNQSYIIINKLMNQNYTFINFTYRDMYYTVKDNNYSNINSIKNFFKIGRMGDISSFLLQYIIFIYAIYYLNKDSFNMYFKIYMKSMNDLYKRSYYYIFINNIISNNIYGNGISKDKSLYLISKPEYVRGISMQFEAMYGIKAVFSLFENEEELGYYYDLSIKIVDNKLLNDTFKNNYIKDINLKREIKEIISNL